MRIFLLFVLLLLLTACSNGNRQEIDLSDRVVANPADGLGHYVYALSLPQQVAPGELLSVEMDWRTVGPADGRKRYALDVLLEGPARKVYPIRANENTVGEINLINWFGYSFPVPRDFPAGDYVLGVRLRDVAENDRVVTLGFDPELALADGFYRVAGLKVVAP